MTGRHHTSRTVRDPRDDPRADGRSMRDRGDPREQPRSARGNEYFVPGDGIEREVIQSDICRYLGRDALVKPINYQGRQGFLITGYRNLTTEMIDSLKSDSAKFIAENRANRAAGYHPVSYDQSETYADSYDEGRVRRAPPSSQPFSGYTSSSRQFEDERGQSPQYYGGSSQAPSQQIPGHPQNYILSNQQEYGAPQRREYTQGSSGQYPYEPRQDGYQPRTPQGQDEGPPRGPVYIQSSGAPYQDIPTTRMPSSGGTYVVDARTGQPLYVDPAYEVGGRRPGQPARSNDRDHRRMR